jgi:outer membrane lipoprotein-sorting protein
MLRKWLIGLLALALPVLPAAAQTVDEVIAKNIEARGGLEKLKSVKSIRLSGKMMMGPGMEAPMTLEIKRPKSLRMEFTFQGMTGVQAYDGQAGWAIMPFQGKKDPEPMSPEDSKDAEEEADLDGPLVDYKAKGHTVELVGKENVEGSDAFKVKVTLKTGTVRYLYIDAESFLEIKAEAKRTVRGSEMEFESTIGDYKEIGGLLIAHSIQSGAKGRPEKQNIVIEKVELNPSLDDARFKMPEAPKAVAPKADAPKADAPKNDPGAASSSKPKPPAQD